MGREDEQLTGFSWRSGSDRETTGILMWSRPFIATLPGSGEEVSVVVMSIMTCRVRQKCRCVRVLIVNVCLFVHAGSHLVAGHSRSL